jgi:glycosyl-4,4'-diaponeurosporenoate acyltransferase
MAPLSPLLPVAACAALWLGWCVVVGALANQLPQPWLTTCPPDPAGPSGWIPLAVYERWLGIRAWKRWIPDAGAALPGGIRKASLARRDPGALQRLIVETRRAELVHWAIWPAWLATALWLPPRGVLLNLLFATLFNLPCLLLQRYTRQRLQLCLRRLTTTP